MMITPQLRPLPLSLSQPRFPATVKSDQKTRNEDSLQCKYCQYVGKYRAEVERHMRLHTGKKPYHCMFCVYKSFWKGDMKRHLQKHHKEEIAQSDRDIKVLVNDTFRPSSEPADDVPDVASAQADLIDYASLIEPEDDQTTETFAEAYPSYPEFGQTVFPGMEAKQQRQYGGGPEEYVRRGLLTVTGALGRDE